MKKINEPNKSQTKVQVKDPICGMIVDKATALQAERDGKTFYFCGRKCLQTFDSAPTGVEPRTQGGDCCG